MPNTNERDALIAALKSELNDDTAAAHIYPSVLRKFEFGEHVDSCFSIKVGSPDEPAGSVGVFTIEQVIDALAAAAPNAGAPLAAEFDVRTIMLDVTPGIDGMGHEVYAKSVADVEAALTKMAEKLDDWETGVLRYRSDAAPAQQAGAPACSAPAAWVSPEQFEAHPDGGLDGSGRYLPMRKSMAGKFTQPLYTRSCEHGCNGCDDCTDYEPASAGAPLPLAPHEWQGHVNNDQHHCAKCGRMESDPVHQQALPLAPSEALMTLSQFAHTAAHMSEHHMRNNLLTIADKLIALASPQQATLPASEATTPRYDEWMSLRTSGQWTDGVPAWSRDHEGKMNDMVAARSVIEELAEALTTRAQPQADAAEPVLLSQWEQKAVLADPMGLECLINYHDAQEAGADAVEHGAGQAHARRALELLAIGRIIIEEDPGIWDFAQKAPFKLRYSERATQAPSAAKKEGQP